MMKIYSKEMCILTDQETEMINITDSVADFVKESGITSGMVFVISLHTTTGITVNEGLPDIEQDISDFLQRIVPDNHPYKHSRYLHSDGQMAINATSHIRGSLLGFEVFFPIETGKIYSGSRQTIYFVELDGPQERRYFMKAIGE
jgi:secondary thiamine-phosphate synthase enzyme